MSKQVINGAALRGASNHHSNSSTFSNFMDSHTILSDAENPPLIYQPYKYAEQDITAIEHIAAENRAQYWFYKDNLVTIDRKKDWGSEDMRAEMKKMGKQEVEKPLVTTIRRVDSKDPSMIKDAIYNVHMKRLSAALLCCGVKMDVSRPDMDSYPDIIGYVQDKARLVMMTETSDFVTEFSRSIQKKEHKSRKWEIDWADRSVPDVTDTSLQWKINAVFRKARVVLLRPAEVKPSQHFCRRLRSFSTTSM